MSTPARSILAATALSIVLAAPAPARCASMKVWVATGGDDSNPCTVQAPCKFLQHAHDVVAAGGEISVLNSGDYANVSIIKSVNITNDGVGEASIAVAAGIGVVIGTGEGDIVSLRGFVIDGQGSGLGGISVQTASAVHVQNCVIKNWRSFGIDMTAFFPTRLFVSDTLVYNNGSVASNAGILIQPDGRAGYNVVLDRVRLENNVHGLRVEGSISGGTGSHAVVRDSLVAGNASDGILAHSQPGFASAFIVVEHTAVVNNAGTGILADGPHAVILLNDDSIKRNGSGINALNSGQLISYGNNRNNNNVGAEGSPTGSYVPM